ncbi:hypothetical protein MPTK1_1g02090 [Marchantia polymorpha subsp. ruderalis]|uniref:Uncharacterized protein n=2 Tax=Marchantia polymorpha TaxID=3197 RepID=A0AAF6AKL7_MARPO|nr:hypothetical protein MARPO_0029s0037 [Marchantia polymorpha]BBM96987.1 hypothetical protein Mp_1g02090 [Marchantia polymorpha subsp. ruderalis]|eukprot:PTQ42494.1 hypothetical protein MARPO_0029s0037 [Marchantia polymorpha]
MSCFRCCTRRAQQDRANDEDSEAATGNQPVVVAISINDSNGEQEHGTGILISDHLVLTSHMGLPSRETARDGQIVLSSVGSSNSTPNKWPSSSTILTRKLLPQRLFLTNPSLGLTIVACEPVTSNSPPREYEIPKASDDALKLGCSVYVLGQVQQDDREGLLMFGEGLISKEDEQVIEFYSLDSYVWAPGSAGFDAKGTFAFVVGDRRPSTKASCPLPKRWSYALSKGPGSRQPGILIHSVRDWTKDTWSGDFNTLLQLSNSDLATADDTSDLEQKAEEERLIEQQRALSKRIDEIQNSMRDDRERLFAAAGPLGRALVANLGAIDTSLQGCGNNLYGATDSTSKISSSRIQEIPVQACLQSTPGPRVVPCSSASSNTQSLSLRAQSPPPLGGIAALAAEELERYDDDSDSDHVADIATSSNLNANSPVKDSVREFACDGAPSFGSPQHEPRSPRSCWFSAWWKNFRPRSPQSQPQTQRVEAVADSVRAEQANEEVMADCLEPNSPPRRFLVRGTYTATPKRENSNILIAEAMSSASSPDRCSSPEDMTQAFQPRNQRPCKCSPQACSRPLSPELAYLQIHRSPTAMCHRQTDIPWKPNGELDSRRILPPPDPPRVITGVARTRTYPRDYCPPRSEDEQVKLDEAGVRKVPAGLGACEKAQELSSQPLDATILQDRILQSAISDPPSPRGSCQENENLDTELSSCPVDDSSTTRREVPEHIGKISASALTSRQASRREIEITCFQRWKKCATRRKNMAVESMRSFFAPRPLSSSYSSPPPPPAFTTLSRSFSPALDFVSRLESTWRSYKLEERARARQAGAAGPREEERYAPYQAPMPNWAAKPRTLRDEPAYLPSARQAFVYGGREDATVAAVSVEEDGSAAAAANAAVKIWKGSCISSLDHQPARGDDREPVARARSHPSTAVEDAGARGMVAVSKKEKTNQLLRKENGIQRPRWSIARVDQGPVVVASMSDPPDDATRSKSKMKRLPVLNTGGPGCEPGAIPHTVRNSGGVRDLANPPDVSGCALRRARREEGHVPPSPSRRKHVNTFAKPKTFTKNSAADEHSTSATKQPLRATNKRLLEGPIGKRGSSVGSGSSSSEREGRPRWR